MDRYRQARRDRKTGPRPQGRVARGLNAFMNAMFFCIWVNPSVNEDNETLPNVKESKLDSVPDNNDFNKESACNSSSVKDDKKEKKKEKANKGRSFRLPWNWKKKKKKTDERKKIKPIEVLTDTFVHLDGFGGYEGQAVKDCVHPNQTGSTTLSASFSSKASTSFVPQEVSLESIKTQDKLSTDASSHWTVSSLPSEYTTSSLTSIWSSLSRTSLSSITSSLSSINTKNQHPQDKVESNSMSSFKWGPLPILSVNFFDESSTSDSDEQVSLEDKREPHSNADGQDIVPGGTTPDIYTLIKQTLNLGMPKLATDATSSSNGTAVKNTVCDSHTSTEPQPQPEINNLSLNDLHTKWLPDDHTNVEVLLGLKEKKSNEVSTLDDENFPEATSDSTTKDKNTGDEEADVKMDETDAVDSGIAYSDPSELIPPV